MTGTSTDRRALIVEDGREAYILAAARALHAVGWTVFLAGPEPNVRGVRSRSVSSWYRVPAPAEGLDAFADAVARIVTETRPTLVFGGDDTELLAVSATRERLGAAVPYAPHERVAAAIDKLRLAEAAARVGLLAPPTVAADDEVVATVDLPVVVKARLHWTPGGGGPGRFPVRVIDDRQDLRARVAEIQEAGNQAMLQAPIDGNLSAVSMVVGRGGGILATVQQVSERLTLGGTSARARTVAVDRTTEEQVHALLRDVGWTGLANLQFLQAADGKAYLIDFNGRFYGSLALALSAGVNLPAIWAADAIGEPPGPVVRGRAGVRFQAFAPDLLRARRQPHGSRLHDVLGTLAYAPRAAHSTLSASDPGPLLAWLGSRAAFALGRLRARART